MSNMTYCRFQNTNPDVQDCMEALNELADLQNEIEWLENSGRDEEPEMKEVTEEFRRNQLSRDEARAAARMLETFLDTMESLGIIEEYDYQKMNDMIDSFTK